MGIGRRIQRSARWLRTMAATVVAAAVVTGYVLAAAAAATGDNISARKAALLAAIDFEGLSNSLAAGMLRDPFPISRILAARALASEADASRLRLVGEYAGDADPWVRYHTMIAAGRMAPNALDLAVSGLGDAAPLVRQAAVWAACHHGEEAYQYVMRRLLTERDPAVLETAIANLWRLGDGPWEDHASRYARHSSPALRRAAASSLARSDRSARAEALRVLAGDSEAVIRATAMAGFQRGPVGAADRTIVLEAVADDDWRVRSAACLVLAARPEIGVSEAVAARIAELWTSPRTQLSVPALRAAAQHPEIGGNGDLRNLARAGEPWLASEALAALARRNAAEAAKIVGSWLADGELWQRRAAARAAAIMNSPGGKLEQRILADTEASVRLAWLENLADAATSRKDALRELLRVDPDPMVRAECLELLGDSAPLSDRDALIELYRRWQTDDAGDARAAALVAALKVSSEGSRAEIIEMATNDRNRMVTAMVVNEARTLGLHATVNSGEPRHGHQWYADLVAWTGDRRWLDVVTERGTVRIRLELEQAPVTSKEIWDLAELGFYDGLTFHRVVPNFVVQGGDPRGDGWGGPGFVIPDEPSLQPFDSWRVGIATSGPQTGGCQFFFMLMPSDRLCGHYTNFGEVVAGRDVLTRIQVGDRILRIERHTGAEPTPPPTTLVGRLTWQDLEPLDRWQAEYEAYQPDPEAVARLVSVNGHYRIVTVLGTWCEDSEREVPRLQRVLDEVDGDRFDLVMIGVDRTKRIGDEDVAAELGGEPVVDRVATIVILDGDGVELGRIVESADRPVEQMLVEFVAPSGGGP